MPAPKIHNFQKSLKVGQKYETMFEDLFGDKVTRTEGYIEDFIVNRTGKTLDLKADNYDMSKTANFFMERYSYKEVNGGPWQALDKGVDYYIYFFPTQMEFFVFKTATLVKKLDELCEGQGLINVWNTSHVTRGYKVNRELLAKIRISLEDIL